MPNGGGDGGAEPKGGGEGSESTLDPNPNQNSGFGPDPNAAAAVIGIVISQPEERAAAVAVSESSAKKACLLRDESYHEQCRVCQQPAEEPLIDLGCRCRGELAKAHRSCIEIWFRTRGSNRCEICQQVAVNISSPAPQPSTNYCVWRVDSTHGEANGGRGGHARGCFSPLWIAFAILIGGLLLDILISVSLGVSALPVNIIIGVLIVLGLGTAMRLAMECCQEWGLRRHAQRADVPLNPGYHAAV